MGPGFKGVCLLLSVCPALAIAQPIGSEISLTAGASYPTGDFKDLDASHNGFTLGGSYGIYMNSRLELGLALNHNGFAADDIVGQGTVIHDRRFTVSRAGLFGKLLILPKYTSPYLRAILGAYRWGERRFIRNVGSPFVEFGSYIDDAIDLGFGLGAGFQARISSDLGLFVEGMWQRIDRSDLHDLVTVDVRAGMTFYPGQ